MPKESGFPIRVVARRTGLSPHVIRAWERRYKVVQPIRSGTNRRLYSARDVEKLSLLRAVISSGNSIGQIAALPVEELRRLALETPGRRPAATRPALSPITESARYLESCTEAVKLMDEEMFEKELGRAGVALGQIGLMERVIAPLLERIGELWRAGELRVAHEHMASAVIRSIMGAICEGFETPGSAPRIVVTTPVGHLHEFGALLAANTASSEGWRVIYLGPNLPAQEIAGAVAGTAAKAVALSLVYPPNDARVSAELKELREHVGHDVAIIVGGRVSDSYQAVLREIEAVCLEDFGAFRSELDRWR